jgi:hypothetical protein
MIMTTARCCRDHSTCTVLSNNHGGFLGYNQSLSNVYGLRLQICHHARTISMVAGSTVPGGA